VPVDDVMAALRWLDRAERGAGLASLVRQEQPGIGAILAGNIETATRKAGDLCDDQPSISKPYDHRFVLNRIPPRTSALRRAADTE